MNKLSTRVAVSASLLTCTMLAIASPALAELPVAGGAVRSLAPVVTGTTAPVQELVKTTSPAAATPQAQAPAKALANPVSKVTELAGQTRADVVHTVTPVTTATDVAAALTHPVAKVVSGTVKSTIGVVPSVVRGTASPSSVPAVLHAITNAAAPTVTQVSSTVTRTLAVAQPVLAPVTGALPEAPDRPILGGPAPRPTERSEGPVDPTIGETAGATQELPAPAAAGGAPGGPTAAGQLPIEEPSAAVLDSRSAHGVHCHGCNAPMAPTLPSGKVPGVSLSSLSGDPAEASTDGPASSGSLNVGHPPLAPQPGPGGGPSGTAAPGGGSGGLTLFTLAGLLMSGGLWARRRLRIASDSLRPVPFVLIPERPG